MLQLSNISWEVNRDACSSTRPTAKIQDDAEAMKIWGREYETGLGAAALAQRGLATQNTTESEESGRK